MKYRKGYKYQLAEDISFVLSNDFKDVKNLYFVHQFFVISNGKVTIKSGYAWDGCSSIAIDTKTSMRGCLIHDCLYQMIRMNVLDKKIRKACDDFAYNCWVSDGMSKMRAKIWRFAIRKFGSKYADNSKLKKVYEV